MQQYLDMIKHVLTNGQEKTDRTGTGTIQVFGYQNRYNLGAGLPVITTKKVSLKNIITELLWFLSGSTNNNDLLKYGNTIWNEWANPETGDLGDIYSKQWTRWEGQKKIVEVKPRLVSREEAISYPIFPLEEATINDGFIGEKFYTNDGDLLVISHDGKFETGHKRYKVQFLDTGYIRFASKRAILKGTVKDNYKPHVFNVGYNGGYECTSELDRRLYSTWYGMISRCYDPLSPSYNLYGGRGIFVRNRWHNFSNFREDVEKIPNWHLKKADLPGYELDKDYFASNCYSKETCTWLTLKENSLYRSSKAFKVIHEDKRESLEISVTDVAIKFNLDKAAIHRVLHNKNNHHKGFKFEYLNDGKVYRYSLPMNQIEWVINEIKTNPDSRRLIVSAWNPTEVETAALPPCHTLFQFEVCNGELNCHLYQRSGDLGLGIPYNITSYSILTYMICHITGLKPGTFVHTISCLHIYKNHINALLEQLKREPLSLPTLKFGRKIDNIFDFELSDFVVENYQSHGKLEMEVAV